MRWLNTWLRPLFNSSFRARLGLIVLSFLLFLILVASGFPALLDEDLLAILLALLVWMCKPRLAWLLVGATILGLAVLTSLTAGSIWWPSSLRIDFLSSCLVFLTEAFVISYLRHARDQAETARLKAQQAEEQITRAYERQRQLDELKDQLLLNLSHELRTPLTAVTGFLELLNEHLERLDAPTKTKFFSLALQNCYELTQLINTMLDAGQLTQEVKPAQREELSVAQVVRAVLEEFDPQQEKEHPLQLEIAEHVTVWANELYFRQVLRNLLSNAFKYTPQQTAVEISAVLRARADQEPEAWSEVLIGVRDAGPGIPPAEQPLLFEKFVRLKRELGGNVRGTGLGLYICKQLVEGMHGRIWVESSGRAGEGCCFCFTLPSSAHTAIQASMDAPIASAEGDRSDQTGDHVAVSGQSF